MATDKETNLLNSAAELRSHAQEQLQAKTAETHLPRSKDATLRLVNELEIYQLEMEEQNTELRRAQEELENQQVELEMQNEELQRVQGDLEFSRNKYSELYDFAPVGYFTFDATGVIQNVNLTGAQMLGIARSSLVDRPFNAFIADPAGREIFAQHLASVLQGSEMQRCEIKLSGKQGTALYGQLQSVTVDASARKDSHILSSIVDGTVARQLGAEVQDAREYAENIVETVRKPLVVLDFDLKILTANHSFYETFKVTHEATIGHFIYDLGNGQWDIPRLRVLFENILPHDTVINDYEVDHEFPGIGRKIILLNARQIFRKNIGSHIILLAMEDITARKQAEEEQARLDQVLQDKNVELEKARAVAEKANLAKSDFLSSMSHELRTPLGAILGFAQLLESGTPPPMPAQKRSVDQILKAGWYLLELINEILDLALIESGKLSLSLEPVALQEVLQECEVMVEPQAQQCGINVTFARLATPYFVNADRTRVKQLLINLLSNAIKYNTEGGTVTVTCTPSPPDAIRISVRDTGAGLAPEQIAQLFQPFNRLGQEAHGEQGTGIGLVVCKRLVELMDGVIGVESSVGEGSVFWLELKQTTEPQAAAHAAELAKVAEAQTRGGKQLYTVLYVEDNPANLMLVEDILARRPDIRLLSAKDGVTGIKMALSSLPDVVLMDINLPGISGIEALKILADNPVTAHIPVVALSANAIPKDIEKGLEAGFVRYLTKPIKVNQFLETLDMVLKHAKTAALAATKEEI
ncbi:MAG: response regulator [Desulfuromonadales bacterium]|nr:response regulator [Desulfuromonadales bacterium]